MDELLERARNNPQSLTFKDLQQLMAEPFPYRIVIRWSDEDSSYIAEVPELPGCMADGPTPEAAIKEAKKALRLWLEVAKKEKREIPRPIDKRRYSGKFLVRVPPDLHRALDFEAKTQKVSLNRLIALKLAS